MKKIIQSLLFILLCVALQNVHAQETTDPVKKDTTIEAQPSAPKIDRLIKKDGTPIAGQVIEITPTDVKYKKATNLGGPTYSIPKRNLARIEYASGEKEDMMVDLIYKKGGGVLDVKILEVTDSQIKYTLMDDPDARPQTMAKSEAEEIEYATGEKINLLPDAIITRDVNTLEVNIVEITYGDIKYKLYNDPSGTIKSISKSKVSSIVYADGKKADYEDWIPFGTDNFLVYSADGKYIITDLAEEDKKLSLCYWNENLELAFIYRNLAAGSKSGGGNYNWQRVTNDGLLLNSSAVYSRDGQLVKYFTNPDSPSKKEGYSGSSVDQVISPKGDRIIFYWGKHLILLNLGGDILKKIKFPRGWPNDIRFSSDGEYFLISILKKAMVFDKQGNQISEFDANPYWVKNDIFSEPGYFSFSLNNKYILGKNLDDEVILWDINGNKVKVFEHQDVRVAAFSRDGKKIVTAGNMPYGKVFMRKLENGEKVTVSATGESPIKKIKGVMSDGIKIWSIDGTLIKAIPFPANPTSVEFTPDGKGIAIVVAGSPLWLWEDEDYKLPEGVEKELIQIAKEEAERKRDERAERRLNFWLKMGETLATGIENNKREMAAFNARMQSRVDQTNRQVAAIEQANRPKPVVQTQNATTQPKAKCNYAFDLSLRQNGRSRVSGPEIVDVTVEISNVYSTTAAVGKSSLGPFTTRYVDKDEEEANEMREDFLDEYSEVRIKNNTKYIYTVTKTQKSNTCR